MGGSAAGGRVVLRAGTTLVGRGSGVHLQLGDPEVSRRHFAVHYDGETAEIEDLGSTNGTLVEGVEVAGRRRLQPEELLQAGESLLTLRRARAGGPRLSSGEEAGSLYFNRPPRITQPARTTQREPPEPPSEPRRMRFPLISMIAPLAIGVVTYFVFKSPLFLLMAAMSPVMGLANFFGDRFGQGREHRQAMARYEQQMEAHRIAVDLEAAQGVAGRRAATPDAAELVAIASKRSARLWERRPGDADFLLVRTGFGELAAGGPDAGGPGSGGPDAGGPDAGGPAPAAKPPSADGENPHPFAGPPAGAPKGLADGSRPGPQPVVPLTVSLKDAGVLGVCGDRVRALALCRHLVSQLAVLHSPDEVRVVLLAAPENAGAWEWSKWLPHLDPSGLSTSCSRLAGFTLGEAQARLSEVRELVGRRLEGGRGQASLISGGRDSERQGQVPAVVLVVDGARRLRHVPDLRSVLEDGPAAGVYSICVESARLDLSRECRAVVELRPAGSLELEAPDLGAIRRVLPDGLTLAESERIARALCPLRDAGAISRSDTSLPDNVRYVDLLPGGFPSAHQLAERWADEGFRSNRFLLGVGEDGAVHLDLRSDGPHGLIAGATGSGKSELLQTLVCSLALVNRPDALNFVLVDYKGGSAFRECARFPHTVGVVTDLDGHLVERALTSLGAELRRREHLFSEAGATDLEDFWRKAPPGRFLSRLVIVVDEFAALVAEVPEFVQGLVDLGNRGRSLGIHVLLATQRPAGVVTQDMKTNLLLRICLRVASATESIDVVDSPLATELVARGRAYVRHGGALELVQVGRVGGPFIGEPGTEVTSSVCVAPFELASLAASRDTGSPSDSAGADTTRTDLSTLADAFSMASTISSLPPPFVPWLPPLPTLVRLADVAELDHPGAGSGASGAAAGSAGASGASGSSGAGPGVPSISPSGGGRVGESASPLAVAVGLADYPAEQSQRPLVVDLAELGNLMVIGGPRSGRSVLLRTLAAALGLRCSPSEVHIYGIDGSTGLLAPVQQLPHCGGVAGVGEAERVRRMVRFLAVEARRRHAVLNAGGFASVADQRASASPGEALAYIVVLVNGLGSLVGAFGDASGDNLADALLELLRPGPSVGIHFVVTCEKRDFMPQVRAAARARFVLRQSDRDDYMVLDVPHRQVPAVMPSGRAFFVLDGARTEVQIASLGDASSLADDLLGFVALGSRCREEAAGDPSLAAGSPTPVHIDPLPEAVSIEELLRGWGAPAQPGGAERMTVVLGIGGDAEPAPATLDLSAKGGLLVVGPHGSGRSSTLGAIGASLAYQPGGPRLVVVCPRPSPLAGLVPEWEGAVLVEGARQIDSSVTELGGDGGPRMVVLVDDADDVEADGELGAWLEALVRSARGANHAIVAASGADELRAQYRGWMAELRKGRPAVFLGGDASDGEALGLRLSRLLCSAASHPGRAILVDRGEQCAIQVAAPARARVEGARGATGAPFSP